MSDGRRFLLVVHAEGDGPPVPIRLRRFLKRLLRGYGVRVESIEEVAGPGGQTAGRLAGPPPGAGAGTGHEPG